MKAMLFALVTFLIVSDALSLELSLAPGLSAKNALLYLAALTLLCRVVLGREKLTAGARGLHVLFGLLLGYAIVTWVVAAFIVEYPRYDAVYSGFKLKSTLVDQLLFFLVFFHGVRSEFEARSTLLGMLVAVVVANFLTVADVSGILSLGLVEQRDDGRVEGALGESNQYAAFIVIFLPAILAAAAAARNLQRWLWIGAALVCTAALIMTVSRGAFVGLIAACVIGMWMMRAQLSAQKVVAWAGAGLLLGLTVLLVLWIDYGPLLVERLVGQSGSTDLGDMSSGRTYIWSTAIERMFASPWTLLSGFGWDVYETMPFRYAPHNHYLGLWFNLGLPGVLAGGLLLFVAIRMAAVAAERAPDDLRPQLVAFVFGGLALAVAVFFVDLYRPWWYFWAYTGLVMRMAVSVLEVVPVRTVVADVRDPRWHAGAVRDGFGWQAVRR